MPRRRFVPWSKSGCAVWLLTIRGPDVDQPGLGASEPGLPGHPGDQGEEGEAPAEQH